MSKETRVEYADERKTLLFDAFNLETAIDKALKKRVWLPCGGYLVFDFAEALTVIDVNSGKMVTGKNMEETALRVNLEAVREIARQLRLRDVGGIVIVDLIDMETDQSRREVLSAFKEAVKTDRMPVKIEGITRLGLLEITRKRKGEQLRRALRTTCSVCSGSGELLSEDEIASGHIDRHGVWRWLVSAGRLWSAFRINRPSCWKRCRSRKTVPRSMRLPQAVIGKNSV